MTVIERVKLGKKQIMRDLKYERFDLTEISCFANLHNHVDANYYGGFFTSEESINIDTINTVQSCLDMWIKGGGLYDGC